MTEQENIANLKAKIIRQRKELRHMNMALRHSRISWAAQVARLRLDLKTQRDYFDKSDYRSMCKCWICRFREWYRFRSGETYPGGRHYKYQYQWRLPFARSGYWPLWK